MCKGTHKRSISQVLKNSSEIGIKNTVYIMFGFPSETKEELNETVDFLHDNKEYIDLVSTSIFGLQKGSKVYKNPENFSVINIVEEERKVLDAKISFEVSSGLSKNEVLRHAKSARNSIKPINKYPKSMNFFREHLFVISTY